MSRAKFKAWARTKGYDLDEWDGDFESLLTIAAHDGWLAGRISMKEEAASKCEFLYGDFDSTYTSDFERYLCADEIKKIVE